MSTNNSHSILIARGNERNITVTERGELLDGSRHGGVPAVGICIGWGDRATIKVLDRGLDIPVGSYYNRRPAPVGRKVSVAANGSYALGNTGARIELKTVGADLIATYHGADQRLAA